MAAGSTRMAMSAITILPVTGLGEIAEGADLPALLAGAVEVQAGDVLVVTQKIVSKAEGRFADLASVAPGREAAALARATDKDPRLVELILRESTAIVRQAKGVLITRHRLGLVMANAGIDASNLGPGGEDRVLLLPQDPDASAARIAGALGIGVVVSDSFGRPWRHGVTNVAIGCAGLPAIDDQRGQPDRDGREMRVTQVAYGDLLASAAGLAMGEGAQGVPAVILRGLRLPEGDIPAGALIRPEAEDLFR